MRKRFELSCTYFSAVAGPIKVDTLLFDDDDQEGDPLVEVWPNTHSCSLYSTSEQLSSRLFTQLKGLICSLVLAGIIDLHGLLLKYLGYGNMPRLTIRSTNSHFLV